MPIAGIGLDLIEVGRVRELLRRHGDAFRRKVFLDSESRYCAGRARSAEHYAGRLAAKEAVMKALGTGWARGVGWQDIEVVGGRGGKPQVRLMGKAAKVASRLHIVVVHLAISHTRGHAVAWAIAERSS